MDDFYLRHAARDWLTAMSREEREELAADYSTTRNTFLIEAERVLLEELNAMTPRRTKLAIVRTDVLVEVFDA